MAEPEVGAMLAQMPVPMVGRLALPDVDLRPPTHSVAATEAVRINTLLTQVASGDRQAFAHLYDQAAGPVFGLIRRVVRDPSMSEEVMQEVMLDVWRQAPRFDPDRGSALAWILTMAHRRAVDRVRSEQAGRDRVNRVAPAPTDLPHDEVEEAALQSAISTEVRSSLASLTPAQREAIELAYYDGLTQSEIAQHLQIPLGTVKTRVRDGMIRLQDVLRELR